MAVSAFPLQWPAGWKRTEPSFRSYGQFGVLKKQYSANHSWSSKEKITVAAAVVRLREEMVRMGVREDDMVISTNLRLRLDGLPRSDQAQPSDPGAAIYCTDPWSRSPRCMAIDNYTKVEQNIAALAATIEAMRAIERHGGAIVIERAFTGFAALPAPSGSADWQVVLELTDLVLPERDDIEKAYRRQAAKHHPDRGGDDARMAAINKAREQALAWLETRK